MQWLAELPWSLVIVACLTIGLAPFAPPHIIEKLQMLYQGTLQRPLDWFDLLMHGAPWVLLVAKIAQTLLVPEGAPPEVAGPEM
ncbi:MAG: RND transporter [Deltaproteobacteria bacterium]|nr:RND transporter [Deltaproteobacteria bacterium]MBW2254315.1 RND transporter [Deltaproteobacteria bacterium]